MHQYKVHLPQRNHWDNCDFDEWLGQSFTEGINRDQRDSQKNNFLPDTHTPMSLDDLPILINGSETEAHGFGRFVKLDVD